MSTITRERIAELANFKPSGANSVNSATREEWQELARIALASLEAEAVGITDSSEIECLERGEMANVMPPDYKGVDAGDEVFVYITPPAPVSVPECFKRLLHHAYGMTMGHDWNKGTMAGHHRAKLCQAVEDCRAAMLQGAERVSNRDELPIWVACSERMPDETQPVITVSDGGVVQRTVYQFCEGVWSDWYEQYDDVKADAFTHWLPLPAAPQQEVKP